MENLTELLQESEREGETNALEWLENHLHSLEDMMEISGAVRCLGKELHDYLKKCLDELDPSRPTVYVVSAKHPELTKYTGDFEVRVFKYPDSGISTPDRTKYYATGPWGCGRNSFTHKGAIRLLIAGSGTEIIDIVDSPINYNRNYWNHDGD